LGLPTEAIGFSNNTPMRFGPPHFEDADVIVPPEGIQTELQLLERVNDFDTAGGRSLGSEFWFL